MKLVHTGDLCRAARFFGEALPHRFTKESGVDERLDHTDWRDEARLKA